jgi:hypothetical protein
MDNEEGTKDDGDDCASKSRFLSKIRKPLHAPSMTMKMMYTELGEPVEDSTLLKLTPKAMAAPLARDGIQHRQGSDEKRAGSHCRAEGDHKPLDYNVKALLRFIGICILNEAGHGSIHLVRHVS